MKQFEIIHEDNACIVINKPAGLAVQGGKGIGRSLDVLLAEAWLERPLLVHRLDQDTSGLILAAKTKAAAAWFSRLFGGTDGKSIIKRYLSVCKGKPALTEGVIKDDLLIRGHVKKSETHYRLLSVCTGEAPAACGGCSLLELELGSGRMHQIRRHLALTGNPVLGDDKYGDFGLNHRLRKTIQLKRLLLHASRLFIAEMPDGSSLDLTAPLPDYFQPFTNTEKIG